MDELAYTFQPGYATGVTVSVVVPALNESDNLVHVLPFVPSWVHEVILVDGHSSDDTIAIARSLLPDIRVVMQSGKGKGAALRSGFRAATGDIIVMIDADGSTDPREIPAFVGALLSGTDFVKGSRFLQGGGTADMPFHRRLGNLGFVYLVRLLFGGRYSDLCYGYSAFWRDAIMHLELDGDGFEIETMMNIRALQAGLKIAEVPSFESPRVHGEGRLRTIPDGWRVLKTIVRERIRPQQFESPGRAPRQISGRLTPFTSQNMSALPSSGFLGRESASRVRAATADADPHAMRFSDAQSSMEAD